MYKEIFFCNLKFEKVFKLKPIFDNKTKLVMASKNDQPISSRFKSLYKTAKCNPVPNWSSHADDFPLVSLHCARPNKSARIKNGNKPFLKR